MSFWVWTIGRPRLYTFSPKVHSGPLLMNIFFSRNRSFSYSRMRPLYSSMILYLEIANRNFPLFFFLLISRDCSPVSEIFSCREKVEHDMLNSNFSKIPFHPKITLFVLLKVKLPNMTE